MISHFAGRASRVFGALCSAVSPSGMAAIAFATLALYAKPSWSQADWTKVADEGVSFTLPAAKLVRYGNPWTPAWTAERSMTGQVACNNATFGSDPSPGTGKQCQTKDIATPAPSPILPPLTSGETYVVTWTPPTKNVDGSPIGTVLRYLIQASATSGFATYYQWETPTQAATYTAKFGPSGVLYWRVAVETADGTSDYSATAVTERQWVAQTKPSCWPKPVGSGSWIKAAQNAEGFALLWHCQENGVWKYAGFLGRWSQLDADWMAQLANAVATDGLGALWDSRITGPSNSANYASLLPLHNALKAANPLPAASAWKVKANGAYTTRAANAIVNGVRTSTTIGRVAVGATCDCSAFSGPGDYCAVTGQLNAATAVPTDTLGPSATVCSK